MTFTAHALENEFTAAVQLPAAIEGQLGEIGNATYPTRITELLLCGDAQFSTVKRAR